MTYIPGRGTTVTFGGKEVGTIEGKAFADALLAVWLGPKPPSADLKAGLLGK
ncbi:MAG: chalcone isomerase family protein [Thermoanaerobaculaceae bacterium]